MFKRIPFVAGALVTASLLTLGTLGPAATSAHAAAPAAQVMLHGVLQPGFATTAPTTLQILTPKHGMFTINVATTTSIIRRYNGLSGLDELSQGDNLTVAGVVSGTGVLNATMVKDLTIQKTFAVSVNSITSISTNQSTKMTSMTLKVLADSRYNSQNPFTEGQTIYANVPATTTVIGSGGSTTTADALFAGEVVTLQGVFNSNSKTYLSVWRIRIGSPKPGVVIEFHGQLQQGFGTAAPTTLSVMTPEHGLVTFTVSDATGLIRRYNGKSSLAELSAGDNVLVFVRFTGPMSQPYPAMTVKDISIQYHAGATVGTIKTISGNTVTLTVLGSSKLYKHQDAFKAGETVTLTISPSTKIILANGTAGTATSLQPNMKIWVNGVANRKAHSYTTVDRIRVL